MGEGLSMADRKVFAESLKAMKVDRAAKAAGPAEATVRERRVERRLAGAFGAAEKGFEEARADFVAAASLNPIQAIDWKAEPMIEAQGRWEVASQARKVFSGVADGDRPLSIDERMEVLAGHVDGELGSILDLLPWNSQSSSPSRNLVESRRLTGRCRMLTELSKLVAELRGDRA